MAKYVPKLAFLVILGQLLAFLAHLVNNANEVSRWFSDMWVLLLPPQKIRILRLKTAFLPDQKNNANNLTR